MAKVAQFYQIYLSPKPGVTEAEIEERMNLALDWYKYGDENWVVFSTSDIPAWHRRLSPIFKPDGYVFIAKLDLEGRRGWMPHSFWDWLKQKR